MCALQVRVVPATAPEILKSCSAVSLERTVGPQFVPDAFFRSLANEAFFVGYTATRPVHQLAIRDATIYGPNLICRGEFLLDENNGYNSVELIHQIPDFPLRRSGGAPGEEPGFRIDAPEATTYIEEACYLQASPNYAAWLLGELPRVFLYKEKSVHMQYLLHGDAHPFHFDSLRLMGITEDRITTVGSAHGIKVAKLTFVTPTYYRHTPMLSMMAKVRDLTERKSATKRIYVSRARSGSKARKIRNEIQLENALAHAGIDIIYPEKLTFGEQVQRFSEAEMVIAPFGAALANLAFAPDEASVFMVNTKLTPEFLRLSLIANLRVTTLPAKPYRLPTGRNYSEAHEFEVPVNEIVAAVT